MVARKVRTTAALSEDLLEAMDSVVREGKVDSRSELLETAIRHELSARRSADIDAAFAHMVDDPTFRREAVEIAEEFESADWEALAPVSSEILSLATASLADVPAADLRLLTRKLEAPES